MNFSRVSVEVAHHVSRGGVGILALCLMAGFAVIAPAAVFFWPDNNQSLTSSAAGPTVADKLNDIGAAQQQTTSAIKTINDGFATERTNLKTLSNQFSALTVRVNTLQGTTTQILHDNERLGERLAEIQIQMARNSVSVAEKLTALTQTIHDDAVAAEQRKGQMDLDVVKASEIQPKKLSPPSAARQAESSILSASVEARSNARFEASLSATFEAGSNATSETRAIECESSPLWRVGLAKFDRAVLNLPASSNVMPLA